MSNNPLQKYFRQPKLFISLPSKGLHYGPGVIKGDSNNMPVFAMTGMDEILMKTPDALFNGEATVKVIESCCPYISDAKHVPSLDIDTLLVAIRIATFGEHMTVSHTCKNCGTENDFDIDLRTVIDHYSNIAFANTLQIDDLSIEVKPLSYQDLTDINVENFKLQKMLSQLQDSTTDDNAVLVQQIYENLAKVQLSVVLKSIESVRTPEGQSVDDPVFIKEWLENLEMVKYDAIKRALEKNKEAWSMPTNHIKCTSCGTEDSFEVTMDQSNFFVVRS